MKKDITIIYMGTPEFAVPPLKSLHKAGFNIPLVVTQPDRKKGRGKKLMPSPVKEAAMELGIEVFQPEKIKTKEALNLLKSFNPDFLVVAAYGQILSKEILEIPSKAPINIHASLLPKYRGASPIQHSVCNGEKETGVTTMFMDVGLDTGDMLLVKKTEIHPDETAGDLHDRLALMGADAIIETISSFDEIERKKQDDSVSSYAPLLKKEDGHIKWDKKASEIKNLIMGMTPWPGAFTFYGEKRLKVFKVDITDQKSSLPPGTIAYVSPDSIYISTGDYDINLKELQPAGKKRMGTDNFLKGHNIEEGAVLS